MKLNHPKKQSFFAFSLLGAFLLLRYVIHRLWGETLLNRL